MPLNEHTTADLMQGEAPTSSVPAMTYAEFLRDRDHLQISPTFGVLVKDFPLSKLCGTHDLPTLDALVEEFVRKILTTKRNNETGQVGGLLEPIRAMMIDDETYLCDGYHRFGAEERLEAMYPGEFTAVYTHIFRGTPLQLLRERLKTQSGKKVLAFSRMIALVKASWGYLPCRGMAFADALQYLSDDRKAIPLRVENDGTYQHQYIRDAVKFAMAKGVDVETAHMGVSIANEICDALGVSPLTAFGFVNTSVRVAPEVSERVRLEKKITLGELSLKQAQTLARSMPNRYQLQVAIVSAYEELQRIVTDDGLVAVIDLLVSHRERVEDVVTSALGNTDPHISSAPSPEDCEIIRADMLCRVAMICVNSIGGRRPISKDSVRRLMTNIRDVVIGSEGYITRAVAVQEYLQKVLSTGEVGQVSSPNRMVAEESVRSEPKFATVGARPIRPWMPGPRIRKVSGDGDGTVRTAVGAEGRPKPGNAETRAEAAGAIPRGTPIVPIEGEPILSSDITPSSERTLQRRVAEFVALVIKSLEFAEGQISLQQETIESMLALLRDIRKKGRLTPELQLKIDEFLDGCTADGFQDSDNGDHQEEPLAPVSRIESYRRDQPPIVPGEDIGGASPETAALAFFERIIRENS